MFDIVVDDDDREVDKLEFNAGHKGKGCLGIGLSQMKASFRYPYKSISTMNNQPIDIGIPMAGMSAASGGFRSMRAARIDTAFIEPIAEPKIQTFAITESAPIVRYRRENTSKGLSSNL